MTESPHLPHITRTLAYYAAFIGFGLTLASLGPTLPGLVEQTKSHLDHISTLFITRSLGYLLGILVCGRVYDHVSGHPVIALCLLTIAGTLALIPSLPSLWLLIAAVFLLGTAEGMIEIGGNTLLIWNHPENLAPFMNGLHFFFGVGAFLSPLIVAQAIGLTQGIAWTYWMLALLIAPIAIWILFLPSPQIQTPPETHAAAQIRPSFIVLVGACFFVFVGAEVGIGGWTYTYAIKQNLATETSAAYLTSGFWGAFTLGRLIAIPISSKLRPQAMLLTDILGAALSIGLILLDLHLPGMDGFEDLRASERTRHARFLAISADAMPGDVPRGLEAGFDACVTKPINVVQFLETISRLLRVSSSAPPKKSPKGSANVQHQRVCKHIARLSTSHNFLE